VHRTSVPHNADPVYGKTSTKCSGNFVTKVFLPDPIQNGCPDARAGTRLDPARPIVDRRWQHHGDHPRR
jgi:hypothetical protein